MSLEEVTENTKKESAWVRWWKELQDDRGARAELRRCATVSEAVFCKGFHGLRRLLKGEDARTDVRRIALLAAILSHIEVDSKESSRMAMGAAMAAPVGDRPLVSDVRFRHLLRTPGSDFDERLPDLVRVLRQMGRRAPVHRLAEDLWWWSDGTRRDWALGYYEQVSKLK